MKMALLEGKFRQLAKKLRNHKRHEAVPKGCFPVDVISEEEQEVIRYIISIELLNCLWFKKLLDEYEDEIRLYANGPITLPCSSHKLEEALYKDRISSRIAIKN